MSGSLLRLVCTATVAAQAVLVPASPAAAAPPPPSVARLLTDLQRLYRQTEQATRAYEAAENGLRRQRAETDRLERELAGARRSLNDSRSAAGRLARQQYQAGTGISPYLRLLLARDPQHALDEDHVIGRLAHVRAEAVRRLMSGEARSDGLARRARKALDDQLTLAGQRTRARDEMRQRLGEIERLLASLTPEQLTALAALEQPGPTGPPHALTTPAAPAAPPS